MATTDQDKLRADETGRLIAANKVDGTAVVNRAGEKLGTVDHVMIDKQTGKVAYAVMSFGGFLGIGDRYHPLPWDVLTYDTNQGGYVVDLDKSKLEGAPSYARDELRNLSDQTRGRQVYDYYGTTPYWG